MRASESIRCLETMEPRERRPMREIARSVLPCDFAAFGPAGEPSPALAVKWCCSPPLLMSPPARRLQSKCNPFSMRRLRYAGQVDAVERGQSASRVDQDHLQRHAAPGGAD